MEINIMLIPTIALNKIISDDIEIKIKEPSRIDGNISLLELIAISKIVKQYKPKNIFEIGTFDGRTTLNMAANSPTDTKVYTLDLKKEDAKKTKYLLYTGAEFSDMTYINKKTSGFRFLGKPEQKKITQLYGDSAKFDFSPYEGKIDLIFVDGSHAQDYVKNDTEIAFRLARNNKSIILWHDYGVWDDVTKVLNNYYKKDKRFKLVRRIDGTCLVLRTI